ncbi:MAG: TetR/AcrR family transcriptional regulator [Candidatus Heimdallarchaeota archaeon]
MSGSNESESEIEEKERKKEEMRQRKKETMRQIILDAALELFIENSQKGCKYDNITMEDIADRAAVSRATLYNYFSCKEEFYFEIGAQGFQEIQETHQAQMTSETSGLDQVLSLCDVELKTIIERPFYHEVIRHFNFSNKEADYSAKEIQQKMELGEEVGCADRMRVKFHLEDEKAWEYDHQVISRGLEDKSIKSDLDIRQLVQFRWMIISGIFDQYNVRKHYLPSLELPAERVIQLTIGLIRNLMAGETK